MDAKKINNTVASVFSFFQKELKGIYDEGEIGSFARLALEFFSGIPYVAFRSNLDVEVDDALFNKYADTVAALKQHQPIQYILGQTEFYGLPIKVTPAVLIPRPETEELVDLIVKQYQHQQGIKALDLCTGSGCIALALNKNMPQSLLWAVDVSTEALAVAAE